MCNVCVCSRRNDDESNQLQYTFINLKLQVSK